jgi:hypothetical protein
MKVGKTIKGFEVIKFQDFYGNKCVLEESSIIFHDKKGTGTLWLGCNTELIHLTRKQVKDLIPHLKAWIDTGSLKIKKLKR